MQKIFKHLETEKHISLWQMGHWRNKEKNQEVSRIAWEWKHNLSEPKGYNKSYLNP
jgi:hypothetical protein